MMKTINEQIMQKTQNVLMFDKSIKHNNFLKILEKDLRNLFDIYFESGGAAPKIKLLKGDLGNLTVAVTLENVKPKKVGINA